MMPFKSIQALYACGCHSRGCLCPANRLTRLLGRRHVISVVSRLANVEQYFLTDHSESPTRSLMRGEGSPASCNDCGPAPSDQTPRLLPAFPAHVGGFARAALYTFTSIPSRLRSASVARRATVPGGC